MRRARPSVSDWPLGRVPSRTRTAPATGRPVSLVTRMAIAPVWATSDDAKNIEATIAASSAGALVAVHVVNAPLPDGCWAMRSLPSSGETRERAPAICEARCVSDELADREAGVASATGGGTRGARVLGGAAGASYAGREYSGGPFANGRVNGARGGAPKNAPWMATTNRPEGVAPAASGALGTA